MSAEAERSLLGKCLLDISVVFDVPQVSPEDFTQTPCAAMWRVLSALAAEGLAPDLALIKSKAQRLAIVEDDWGTEGIEGTYADLMMAAASSSGAEACAEVLMEASTLRRLRLAAHKMLALADDASLDTNSMLGAASTELAATETYDTSSCKDGRTLATDLWEERQRRLNTGHIPGVSSGFWVLDKATNGFQNGEMTLVAARPSVGKSSFALDITRNALKAKLRVLYFTIEMRSDIVVNRLISGSAQVDGRRLQAAQLDGAEEARIIQALGELSGSGLIIDDNPKPSLDYIRGLCRKQKRRMGLDLVVVDHLGLIPQPRQLSQIEHITQVSLGLRALARDANIPMLALSQLSRENERNNRKPRLSDLRDSGSLEQDADVVIMLHRERDSDTQLFDNKTEIMLQKNRNGPVAHTEMMFVPELTTFREIQR